MENKEAVRRGTRNDRRGQTFGFETGGPPIRDGVRPLCSTSRWFGNRGRRSAALRTGGLFDSGIRRGRDRRDGCKRKAREQQPQPVEQI